VLKWLHGIIVFSVGGHQQRFAMLRLVFILYE